MARTRATVSTDQLVHAALLRAAEAGEVELTGPAGLFANARGANRDAIAACRDAGNPLLAVVRSEGRVEFVALTPAGFEWIAGDVPEEKVGTVAKRVASALPPSKRIDFIQDTIRRTPLAAVELTPVLEEAIATEKAESEARIAAAAKRRAAEETAKKAIERVLGLIEERKQNRLDALKREWEAEGAKADELPAQNPRPQREPSATSSDEPHSDEDNDFRRSETDRLAAAWRDAWDAKKDEGRDCLEAAMWNIRGFRMIGEVGLKTAFDGRYHECDASAFTGDPVRVVRPGWLLKEAEGDYVSLKAAVVKP